MSSVPSVVCELCKQVVQGVDKQNHANGHTGGAAPRPSFGNRSMTDAVYVMRSYKPHTASGGTGPVAGKHLGLAFTCMEAMGCTDRKMEATQSGLIGAGSKLTEQGAIQVMQYLKNNVFNFDEPSFFLSLFEWMAITGGSPQELDAGSWLLKPSKTSGLGGSAQNVSVAAVITALDTMGREVGLTLTIRKFFEVPSIFKMAMELYKDHRAFNSLRELGTPMSNAAGIPAKFFYKAIPSWSRCTSTADMTDEEIQQQHLRNTMANVPLGTNNVQGLYFDPAHQNPNFVQQQPPVVTPTAQLATNVAAQGLVRSLQSPVGGP